tara:strand:- start:124 stop:702 length:579 start_codon:yes stop_codon:yes gene_type:complete
MPKKPINYAKTIIYTIRTGNSLYVGSTTDYTNRKYKHKSNITNENHKSYNYKLYKTIRENGEWDMQPHSKYQCNDGVEQKLEEERIRQLLKADLNTVSCGTGLNCSELGEKEYKKQYWTENKDKLTEQQKQYRTDNKDKLAEQQKQYYTNNKDKILEQMNQKVTCECGCIVNRSSLTRHKRTKTHLKLMENK